MSTRFTILHTEDQPAERRTLARYLAHEPDCELIEAGDGLEAWRLLEAGVHPDLCVLDLLMPGLDGLSLLRRMRADTRFAQLRVVLCTVVQEPYIIRAAAQLGVDYYLVKPYTALLVREQIRMVRLARNPSVTDGSGTACGARPGIAPATGDERLAEFARKLNISLEAVEKCLADLDTDAAIAHLRHLKSIAQGSDLQSLHNELAQLERILVAFNRSWLGALVGTRDPEMFMEWRQEAWRREYHSAVLPSLTRLKRMAESWGRSQAVIASPTSGVRRQPPPAAAAD